MVTFITAEAIAAVTLKLHNFATKQKQLSSEGPACSFSAICHVASVDRAVLCGSAGDSGRVGRGGCGGGASRRLFICDCRVGTLMCNRYWITLLGEDPYFILLLLSSGQCRTLYCRCKLHVRGRWWAHGAASQRIPHSETIITTITINSVCSTFAPSVRATMLSVFLLIGLFSPAPTSST